MSSVSLTKPFSDYLLAYNYNHALPTVPPPIQSEAGVAGILLAPVPPQPPTDQERPPDPQQIMPLPLPNEENSGCPATLPPPPTEVQSALSPAPDP